MRYQQNITSFQLGIVVIVTTGLQLPLLERALNDLRMAIERVEPGNVIHVTVPH